MTVQSTTEYWTCLEKSGLFDADQLEGLRAKFAEVRDPPRLARKLIDEGSLTDWQARFLLTGRSQLRIGPYILVERISSQLAGDRFLARHTSLEREVEVNVFPASLSDNKALLDQLLAQARKVAGIDHPNLVHLYDIDKEGGRYYFVYERDKGTRLDRLQQRSLNASQIAGIVKQLLCGLECARQHALFHGKLTESQVRVDERGHARISNIGLATMLDEVSHAENGTATGSSPRRGLEDDLQAAGSIGQNLLDRHIGTSEPTDELEAIFFEIKEIPEATEQRISECISHLELWDTDGGNTGGAPETRTTGTGDFVEAPATAELSPLNPIDPLPASFDDFSADAGSTSIFPSPAPPGRSQTPKAKPSRLPSKPDVNTGNRTKLLPNLIGGALAVALMSIAGWLWLGRQQNEMPDLSQARGLDEVDTGKRSSTETAGGQNAAPGEKEGAFGDKSPSSAAESSGKNPSPLDSAINDTKEESSPPELSAADSESAANDESAAGDQVVDSNEQQDQETGKSEAPATAAQEIVKSPIPAVGEAVNGIPVIDWNKAAEYSGQKVVVVGKVAGTGTDRSGSITFLNFDKSNRDAFTVVVKRKAYSLFAEEPKDFFKGKDVVVVGTVYLYQDRVPQIEVSSIEQIALAEGIVAGTTQMPGSAATMPSAGNQTGSDPTADSSGSREAAGHFATLPAALPVPEFSKDATAYDAVELGSVNAGDQLLAMEIVVPAGFGIKNGQVSIERAADDRNRWSFRFSERSADPMVDVAELVREGQTLKFRWTVPESIGPSVNYIRNCLLRIQSPSESVLVGLRTPLEMDEVVLTTKKASWRENIPVDYPPEKEFLFAELMPLSSEAFPDQISELGYEVSAKQPATEAYFERDVTRRVFALGFAVQFGSRIRIDAGLLHISPGGFVPFRENTYKELGELIARQQQAISNEKLAADNFEAPTGQKTKHKDYVKELSKNLDAINAQLDAFNASRDALPKIMAEPVRFRIAYRTDAGKEIEIARTKGFAIVELPPPPADEGKGN